ncbi:DUF2061 domain-containing protein [Anianabacter salinae]|uniref:DUF2061 domain-containing protein n=1 Tax=Anianabacter salinae TaxID=2851023 RepID=UPI00225E51B6|nr:DUF2061 domain-containing protein [Anianabacter salinae]MBV0911401.1 DUF2061 domain-containing protein [Anianabacter salinae]
METRRRTIVKAIVWNIIGLATMSLVGWLATGSVAAGGGIAVVNTAVGFTLYILYERVWAGIRWGRVIADLRDGFTTSAAR